MVSPARIIASLGGILVIASVKAAVWENCPQKIDEGLIGLKEWIGHDDMTWTKKSICSKVVVRNMAAGLKAHPDCAIRQTEGKPGCKDQRTILTLENVEFECVIADVADLLGMFNKGGGGVSKVKLPLKGAVTVKGKWSKFHCFMEMLINEAAGTVNVTKSELKSDKGSLKIECDAKGLIQLFCGVIKKNDTMSAEIGDRFQNAFKTMLPAMVTDFGDKLTKLNCI